MTYRFYVQGKAISLRLYKLNDESVSRQLKDGTFYPRSYIRALDPHDETPEIFGMSFGWFSRHDEKREQISIDSLEICQRTTISPNTLVVGQGFEGEIFDGSLASSDASIESLFEAHVVENSGDQPLSLALPKDGSDVQRRDDWQFSRYPARFRLVRANGSVTDLDELIVEHRAKFDLAIEADDQDTIRQMLENGFNIHAEYQGDSAAEMPQMRCKTRRMYDYLCSVDSAIHDPQDTTETICAVQALVGGALSSDVLELIASRDNFIDSEWEGGSGRLAIHVAAASGKLEPVRVLVECGASLSIASNDGETPLGLAVSTGNTFLVSYLLEQGAPLDVGDYRTLDLDGEEVEIEDPRNQITSREMAMIIEQYT